MNNSGLNIIPYNTYSFHTLPVYHHRQIQLLGHFPHRQDTNSHYPSIQPLMKDYSLSPTVSMARQDIHHMNDRDLLDIDCLHKEEDTDNDFIEDGFCIF